MLEVKWCSGQESSSLASYFLKQQGMNSTSGTKMSRTMKPIAVVAQELELE
jgi:hypothetical protein